MPRDGRRGDECVWECAGEYVDTLVLKLNEPEPQTLIDCLAQYKETHLLAKIIF